MGSVGNTISDIGRGDIGRALTSPIGLATMIGGPGIGLTAGALQDSGIINSQGSLDLFKGYNFKTPELKNREMRQEEINKILALYGAGTTAPNTQSGQNQQASYQQLQQIANEIGSNKNSITDLMLKKAMEGNLSQAQALQASQRGNVNPGLSQRQTLSQVATTNQELNAQAQAQRIQEELGRLQAQAQVTALAGELAGQQRSQDTQIEQMRNQIAQSYLAMGLSQDQAIMQAELDANRIRAGITESENAGKAALAGGLLGAGSGLLTKFAAPAPSMGKYSGGF